MRSVFLIRHGEPAFPEGKKFCLSATDLTLSPLGRMQAVLTAASLPAFAPGHIFSSPLKRASETAACIGTPQITEALKELGVGAWEGLTFPEIRERYPEVYLKRGENPYLACIPEGEAPQVCRQRMLRCIDSLLARTEGDVAVVSHAGAIRLYLSALNLCPAKAFLSLPQPYGGITELRYERGVLTPAAIGTQPKPPLTRALCLKLLTAYGTPKAIVRHALAVESQALRLAAGRLCEADTALLSHAALLHDIAHTEPFHEQAGAQLLEELGYPEEAALVRAHTNLPEGAEQSLTPISLLFLADKTVFGETPVTVQERFRNAEKKCLTPEAKAAHAKRYAAALKLISLTEEG